MKKEILTRMGDGQRVSMSPAQVKEDITAGTKDAADRGKIPELTASEQEHLFEIIADENRVVGVKPGDEVVLSDDVSYIRMNQDEGASGGLGIPMSPPMSMLVHERAFAQDSVVMGCTGSGRKHGINWKLQQIETTQLTLTVPMIYVSGPALLTFYKPLGPYDNPSDLLHQGKIQEARKAQEEAVAAATEELVWLCKRLASVGVDCVLLDCTAAQGDADFYGTLDAVEKIKADAPEMAIQMPMAGEFILGMHGEVTYKGQRLAGMYPHEQLKMAEAAGVDIFGPVINTNCSKSFPWNISKVATFVKHTSEISNIPIHPHTGQAMCAVPMCPVVPLDCVSRTAKILVELGKADGLQVSVGDPFGMSIAEGLAAGMGGIRTAGDLVMRMQQSRKMRLPEAKKYVAEKLKVTPADLSDECTMRDVRGDLGIGTVTSVVGTPNGMAAKFRIAELLGIEISGVNKFKQKAGPSV